VLLLDLRNYLAQERITYAEVTFSPIEYLHSGITLEELCETISQTNSWTGCRVFWIVDLVRNIGASRAEELLRRLFKLGIPPSIVGITLGGNEAVFPSSDFRQVYHLAKDSGLSTSIHAGEALGPES